MVVLLAACDSPTIDSEAPLDDTAASSSAANTPTACDADALQVALHDASQVGVSAEEFAAFLGERSATLIYRDGTETPLSFSATILGDEALYWTFTPSADEPTCPEPYLQVELWISLATADGVFDEVLPHTAQLLGPPEFHNIQGGLETDEIVGTFTRDGMDALSIPMNLSATDWSGEIVTIDNVNDPTEMLVECGIGSWNGSLMTGCSE